ncbi:hypothetical protein ACN27G_21415 [Plantactinospora sp. WMMB334]|uniref:hypothetical protein n=1 Tax=Plantactinospora sp. WMMB334 TaxID=3404119 RepID=UPI003B9355A9
MSRWAVAGTGRRAVDVGIVALTGAVTAYRMAVALPLTVFATVGGVAVGVLLCLGALAFPLSRISREAAVAHVADLLLLLPFLYLGVRALRGRSGSRPAGAVPPEVVSGRNSSMASESRT